MTIRLEWNTVSAPAAFDAVAEDGLELPDLSRFPNPVDKAHALLEVASEVEHMLLVQYLYAWLTLKSGAPLATLTAGERAAVAAWKRTLRQVAVEEMGHLMSVQNLRLFCGADPIFDREEFPPKLDIYPFPLRLEPLTPRSLAKYVLAESPFADDAALQAYRDLLGSSMRVQRVGIVYALLGVLFSSPATLPPPDASTGWDRFVARVATLAGARADPARWHIPDAALHPDSVEKQAEAAHFGATEDVADGVFVRRIASAPEACRLIKDIAEQGEASGAPTDISSHYRRFRDAFEGTAAALPFPKEGDAFVPWQDVDADPTLASYEGDALALARELDAAYASMLLSLVEYLKSQVKADRDRHAGDAMDQMRELKRVAQRLVNTTQRPGTTRFASPVFTVPASMKTIRTP